MWAWRVIGRNRLINGGVINHKRGAAVPKSPQQKSRWPIRLSQHAPTRPVSNNCPLGVSQRRSSAGRPAQGQGRVATTGEEGVRLVWSFRRLPTTTMTTSAGTARHITGRSSMAMGKRAFVASLESYHTHESRWARLLLRTQTHHDRSPRGSAHVQPRRVWLCHRTGALLPRSQSHTRVHADTPNSAHPFIR